MSYFDELQLKTVFRQENTFLIFSLRKKEHINENQLLFLENKSEHGLLNVTWTKNSTGNRLVFNISNLVCLSEYIKSEMTQDKYFEIVSQFQKIMEFCSNSTMPVNNLLCSLKHVYFDPLTQKIFAVYLPVINSTHSTNIVRFLYELNKKSNIIVSNSNYMSKYQDFLDHHMLIQKKSKNKNACFSHNDLYNFLHDMKNIPASNIPPGSPVSDRKESSGTAAPTAADSGTSDPYYTPTQPETSSGVYPYLTDSSGGRYYIDHTPFNIGRNPKGPNIDISLSSVGEVSGFHASIIEKDNSYYIKDNNSTNGTFISNQRIQCQMLSDNDTFCIYNIPFTFHRTENITKTCIAGALGGTRTLCVNSVHTSSYTAYIKNDRNPDIISVYSYPFTCAELSGITIDTTTSGSSKNIFICNTSCSSLTVENEQIAQGDKISLFSGCSFCLGDIRYTFYIKD